MTKRNFRHKNDEEITAYLADNKLEAQKSDSGIYYHISKEGEGKHPTCTSNITISYIGYFTDGNTFDQNERLEINMADVIAGWTEGIQYFKEGGEGILFIPSHLAYGNTDFGFIPAGTVLIFDIQLIGVDAV
ncbi:FKBP-type peptidyl-prolyl cis-trans isomerase [Labilibaculum manganireducens]|uniref:FKBP-type peptidyl-prolyl cis-trans isomerase n=1 Tax=Labilibaculum manganireducens TaxID=1940525 RepID=UPI000C6E63BD|nr:FKBP-type peptidyl-prolyl cis-trans isomerase [Labilibaculum manganireducens]